MAKLFLSYRRDDSADVAGRISDRLIQHFGKGSVFTDVDSIPLGANFAKYIDQHVAQCDIFLAAMGPDWLSLLHSRQDDPKDFVRIEIESALKRDIPVIPLLVRGGSVPSEAELPSSLRELAYRQGTPIRSGQGFHSDVDRLIKGLGLQARKFKRGLFAALTVLAVLGIAGIFFSKFDVPDREPTIKQTEPIRSPEKPESDSKEVLASLDEAKIQAAKTKDAGSTAKSKITSIQQQVVPPKFALTIDAVPTDANVRILNIKPRYTPGMNLAPGKYKIEVSKEGFETKTKWVNLKQDEKLRVSLKPKPPEQPTQNAKLVIPAMVNIPAGCFEMGSPANEPVRDNDERQHRVCVKAFMLSRYEVTFAEYDAFAEATQREKPDDEGWGRGRRPVINVSWKDASDYAAWLSQETGKMYRLPTEAEWEYAARAETMTAFWFGDTISPAQANYNGSASYNGGPTGKYREQTLEVGQFEANPFSLYDVHGNVAEWTCSAYDQEYKGGEATCADADAKVSRVLRGGSWITIPGSMRSATRGYFDAADRGIGVGFRLARALP